SPTGLIPKHEDLVELFREIRGKEYTWEEYEQQFSIRVKWLLKKVGRVEEFWRKEEGTPKEVFEVLEETREGLEELKKRFGDPVSPRKLEEE
ncbi:MAG: hypothetical protein QW356_08430, partial [Candidatus Hadarchaeales archaeon]